MAGPFDDIMKSVDEVKYIAVSGIEYMKLFFAVKRKKKDNMIGFVSNIPTVVSFDIYIVGP